MALHPPKNKIIVLNSQKLRKSYHLYQLSKKKKELKILI
jgi:hypothetical protein